MKCSEKPISIGKQFAVHLLCFHFWLGNRFPFFLFRWPRCSTQMHINIITNWEKEKEIISSSHFTQSMRYKFHYRCSLASISLLFRRIKSNKNPFSPSKKKRIAQYSSSFPCYTHINLSQSVSMKSDAASYIHIYFCVFILYFEKIYGEFTAPCLLLVPGHKRSKW